MKKFLKIFFLSVAVSPAVGQNYVTIPDSNFAVWLNANYPTCMNGNMMDTTCAGITSEDSVDVSYGTVGYITDLTGIEYFTGLTYLNCDYNHLTTIPPLPANLLYLTCNYNYLTSLPALPTNLVKLYCYYNQLPNLPTLPANLITLYCLSNLLTSLPTLPATLLYLNCENNQLTSLPSLPVNLAGITCGFNQLTSLPALPSGMGTLYCQNNLLTSLPIMDDYLIWLDCSNNNITCFPVFHSPGNGTDTGNISISGNPITCLPNYVYTMDAATLAYPLCVDNDLINNPNTCPGADGIVGYTFKDNNSNCLKDTSDSALIHIPIQLFDSSNNFLTQTYSFSNGLYNIQKTAGTYLVEIDTAGMPFTVQCIFPGVDSAVTLTTGNPLVSDVNFEFACKPGFDVGVQAVIPSGRVIPGQQHSLQIIAGDLTKWYNLNCTGTTGVSGQVQVSVTGPVTYIGIASGALTPSVSGNVFTYTIADYSTVNILKDFGLQFQTNFTAQAGDFICVNVTVTPTAGDNNTSNNNYQFCYQVVNSFDPNKKEVSPVNVLPGYQDYFTYTIHFQNTGTSPAINILLADTLNANLDLKTFQVISFSHDNTVSLDSNIIRFRFNNIMLPDSTTNEPGSKGFIQYRIKPKANLPLGTQLKNTAYIYFDYNAAIVTNTTINEYVQTLSINNSTGTAVMNIYPNPTTGKFIINGSDNIKSVEIYNILGETVKKISSQQLTVSNKQMEVSLNEKGIYFIKLVSGNKIVMQKLIVQ